MSLYLSKLSLNIRNRIVQQDIRNCQAMHQRIMSGFNNNIPSITPRSKIGLLYKLETNNDQETILFIQSNQEPDWSKLPLKYLLSNNDEISEKPFSAQLRREITPFLDHLSLNRHYRFQLLACPCKKVGTNTKEELQRGIKNNGKRIPLKTQEEKEKWINKKGNEHGFKIETVEIDSKPPVFGKKKSPNEDYMKHQGAYYRGILQITNLENFKETIQNGIGPAKSYGFGLMMISLIT